MTANWEAIKKLEFEGNTLVNAGYTGDKGDTEHRVTQFYVNEVQIGEQANRYGATWDFNDFIDAEEKGTFEWPAPHAYRLEREYNKQTISYFTGPKFIPLNKNFHIGEKVLTILNRPVRFARMAGTLNFYAGAVDQDNNAYQVYWNMFNVLDPVAVELTVDYSRYCDNCKQTWTRPTANDVCNHVWVHNH